jgi:hypothetical protein
MEEYAHEARELRHVLASIAEDVSEKVLQRRVMEPLGAFVAAVSGDRIRLHDTHARRYLAGLKPDITGTATTTASELDVFPPQVELIIKMKSGSVNLDTDLSRT